MLQTKVLYTDQSLTYKDEGIDLDYNICGMFGKDIIANNTKFKCSNGMIQGSMNPINPSKMRFENCIFDGRNASICIFDICYSQTEFINCSFINFNTTILNSVNMGKCQYTQETSESYNLQTKPHVVLKDCFFNNCHVKNEQSLMHFEYTTSSEHDSSVIITNCEFSDCTSCRNGLITLTDIADTGNPTLLLQHCIFTNEIMNNTNKTHQDYSARMKCIYCHFIRCDKDSVLTEIT